MKMIILAAGEGSRLRPHTLDKPKCMTPFNGQPVINHILDAAKRAAITDIVIVDGYKKEALEKHLAKENVSFVSNDDYASTNMVSTLFCAEKEMTGDIIISYSDIIYHSELLLKLKKSRAGISVLIDKNWLELWSMRMENPLADAETLKVDSHGNITEIGKKPRSLADINGQYIGLIKISSSALDKVKSFYHNLDQNALYDGKSFHKMYMTSLLQLIIERLAPVKAVPVAGGWLEIDSVDDLKAYKENIDSKIIRRIFKP